MAGSAAAVLIGLIFVVISLMQDRSRSTVLAGSRLYMGPIVLGVSFVLVLSAAALTPGMSAGWFAFISGAIALWGLVRGPAGRGKRPGPRHHGTLCARASAPDRPCLRRSGGLLPARGIGAGSGSPHGRRAVDQRPASASNADPLHAGMRRHAGGPALPSPLRARGPHGILGPDRADARLPRLTRSISFSSFRSRDRAPKPPPTRRIGPCARQGG